MIGRGSFGEVYLVEKLDTNQLLAMKILHKSKIQSKFILIIKKRIKFNQICLN